MNVDHEKLDSNTHSKHSLECEYLRIRGFMREKYSIVPEKLITTTRGGHNIYYYGLVFNYTLGDDLYTICHKLIKTLNQ